MERQDVYARCSACAHVFVVTTLPRPIDAFARALKRARCPRCDADAKSLTASDGSADWQPR